jgi:adenylate cyclase
MRRLTAALILGTSIALGGVVAVAIAPWLDIEQELGLAWLFHARGPVRPPDDVVIVAIDEDSAQHLGLPDKPREWPRTIHAELVRYLAQAGARIIVFDLTFDTPSPRADDDAAFASAARTAGNVLVTQSVHRDTLYVDGTAGSPAGTVVIDRPAPPVPVIEQAVAGYAPFLLPKASRVDAYWTFWSGAPDQPTLPVLALRVYASAGRAGQGPGGPSAQDRKRWNATLAGLEAAGDTSYFNLYGPPHTVSTVPYYRVLALARAESTPGAAGGLDAAMFRGKAVFVGLSARTPAAQDRLRDDYGTVYSQANGLNLTGVELAATAFANLVEGRPLRPAASAWHYAMALLWASGLALLCHRLPPVRATAVTGVAAALYLWLVYERFASAALWLPSVVPIVVQVPLALFATISIRYRVSRLEREAIKRAFGHFVPSEMVDRLALDMGPVTRSNRVVFGSCLATDAGNYTTLAEKMEPGQLGQLMNAYFAQLFVPVERSGGAVVDVVGDAMVAIWAASKSGEGLRRNACEAALDIMAAVDRFNRGLTGGLWLPTRLALHSGDMLVGNIGASHHYEYRAVGDIVNTASRLQGLNKILGTSLLASAATVEGLDELATRPLGSFVLAGKATALAVVEVLGRRVDANPARDRLCTQFDRALTSYRSGHWREAVERFAEVLVDAPDDGPARFYLARCNELLANPPEGWWNPTITVSSK